MIISTSEIDVKSSSYVSFALPILFFRQFFVDWIIRSKTPPCQGAAFSKLKDQSTLTRMKCCFTSGWVNTFTIVLAADLNVLALSDIILMGNPRRAVNLLKQRIKVGAVRSGTSSRCMARTIQQVKRQIQTFLPWLIYNGPAKSTPVQQNGGASLTLHGGSGGGGGGLKGFAVNQQHIVHLYSIFRTNCLPPIIQYCECISDTIVSNLVVAVLHNEGC